MTISIAPTQDSLTQAIRTFLTGILPGTTDVILAQANRVPEPSGPDFVLMTPIRFDRLSTNLDTSLDSKLTGTIAGDQMDITAVNPILNGPIVVGSQIFGVNVTPGTTVISFGTGSGGIGTYTISPAQTIAAPQTLSAGRKVMMQAAQVTVQLDFHSENITDAGNTAQIVATLLRDEYGVTAFANQQPNSGVVPLLADDPRQMPFLNDQQQYEWRWILEAKFQVNQQVYVPQEFADAVEVGLIEIDERYPP